MRRGGDGSAGSWSYRCWLLASLACWCLLATERSLAQEATLPAGSAAQAAADNGQLSPLPAMSDSDEEAPPGRSGLKALLDGGPLMVPILACSLVLFIYIFERVICLRRERVIPGPFVRRLLDQIAEDELKPEEALQLCQENGSPMAEVFSAAIKKWGRPSVEVEQAVLDTGERVASRLRKHLRVFHGVYTVGPLLGLLGTVLGMIQSFNAVAASDAMGRPELLAAGISQALLTTAGGLSVAIPAILAHLYFVGRVDKLVSEIDLLGQDMVNSISSDGWREKREKKPAKTVKPEKKAA